MRYAGDGHDHWHIRRILSYHLWSGSGTTRDAKIGFCFFDTNRRTTALPGAPTSRKYTQAGCGKKNSLSTRTGISVGWADLYPADFAYQWIDITGLPAGTYTIRAAVDLYKQFAEVSEANNCAYARISFKATGTAVKVLSTGTTCLTDGASSGYADDIAWASGLISNCDADMFCPYAYVTREQVARAFARALDLPAATEDFFTDDNGLAREADINRVAAAGLMTGCGTRRFCPTGLVSRGSLATFFVRALGLPPTDEDDFTDDETKANEADINAAVAAGIMNGCGPTTFCPTTAAKRGQTTRWLHHAFGAVWPPPPATSAAEAPDRLDAGGSSIFPEELIPDWDAVVSRVDAGDPPGPSAVGSTVMDAGDAPGRSVVAASLVCSIMPRARAART